MTQDLQNTSPYQLVNSLSFCVFDLETTGGNHQHDKVIEIGLVKIENLKIKAQKSFLINPEMHIPEFIQKLTDIKDQDVQNAPIIDDVIDEILEFMSDSILVAHNTSFDIPFFNSVLRRLGRPEIENKAICTNLMTKYMIPNLLSSNLNYMSTIFKLEHQKAHRALDDAKASAGLLLKFLDIFIHKNISKVNNLYYPKNKFELDRINYKPESEQEVIFQKIRSLTSPFLVIIKGNEGVVLFALPCHPNEEEKNYIIEKIKTIPYQMVTIKLCGPYLQGIIEMSSLFPKIANEYTLEALKYLCKFNQIDLEKVQVETPQEVDADFVILNHLNPEQFVIYPLRSLQHKLELVFRYPTHQNKLVQYINSKSARMSQGKMKKDHLNIKINNFLAEYLKTKSDFLLLPKENAKITNNDIKDRLEKFIQDNPNDYNFPNQYL